MTCPLCENDGGEVLWRDEHLRIVLADEPDFPGFLRVIVTRHVREMTDLAAADVQRVMDAVQRAERALRELLRPDKINLASLGNVVPHVHWHVIPRFLDDPCFPDPIWAPPRRKRSRAEPADLAARLRAALRCPP